MEEFVPPDMFIREENSGSIKNSLDCFFVQSLFHWCLTLRTIHDWNTNITNIITTLIFLRNESWQTFKGIPEEKINHWPTLTKPFLWLPAVSQLTGSYCGRGECRVPTQPEQSQREAPHCWTWTVKPLLRPPRLSLCSPLRPGAPVGWAAWGSSSASAGAAELCSSAPPLAHWDENICSVTITGATLICPDMPHLLTNEPDRAKC